jgi:hypothetical protein
MGHTYRPIQYFWLWVRCFGATTATAFTVAGYTSLIGETSTGAVIQANVTAWFNTSLENVPAMNTFWAQATFWAFVGVLLAGILWATVLTIYKSMKKQSPSIFRSSDERFASLEKRITDLESKIKELDG